MIQQANRRSIALQTFLKTQRSQCQLRVIVSGHKRRSPQPVTSTSSDQSSTKEKGRGRHQVKCYDLHDQLIPYEKAWAWQQKLVSELLTEAEHNSLGHVLILQHPPVLTLGAGSTESNLLFDPNGPPLPLFRTERGGEATFHGPGQLVMYPILNLQKLQPDLHWYLRSLEDVIIRALKEVSSIQGEQIDGLTGVWVENQKIAALGIRARRWITYHGLALNISPDLSHYKYIIPCGISDKPVTSVAELCEKTGGAEGVSADSLLSRYATALLTAFEEVFDCSLDCGGLASETLPG